MLIHEKYFIQLIKFSLILFLFFTTRKRDKREQIRMLSLVCVTTVQVVLNKLTYPQHLKN